MQRYQEEGIEWLQFDLLSDISTLRHATFLRKGGVSQGAFHSLNTSQDVGDNPIDVQNNLARIGKVFHRDNDIFQWIDAKQSHSKKVLTIQSNSLLNKREGDALITSEKGISLLIKHADCQAALFYDYKNRAIANVHAGWRGQVLNIYEETIRAMQRTFGSAPQDLLVCISPSLGPENAEFIHYREELPQEFWPFQVKPTYFDFWAISQYQLQQAGILPHHIEIAKINTYAHPADYFSYRREHLTGRHATCITLLV